MIAIAYRRVRGRFTPEAFASLTLEQVVEAVREEIRDLMAAREITPNREVHLK
jgi:hypothetical protein